MTTPPIPPNQHHIRQAERPDLSKYVEFAVYDFDTGKVSYWGIETLDDRWDYWKPIIAALAYKAWMMEARRLKARVDEKDKATAEDIDEDFMQEYITLRDERWKAFDNANLWVKWETEQ